MTKSATARMRREEKRGTTVLTQGKEEKMDSIDDRRRSKISDM